MSRKAWLSEDEKILHLKFQQCRGNARTKNVTWNLSLTEFATFWKKPCHYCTIGIKTIGLDRMVPKHGYILSNIVPCCWDCNELKSDMTKREFLNLVRKIVLVQHRGI